MVSTFNEKFRQDLEIIYAKYSHPFDDAPEFILNTCDLPENVKLIESYKYSNCGKWKVSGNSLCEDDNNFDDECSFDDLFTSHEENQYSSYESDDNSSVSSECSGSFQLQKSFRDKHPRSCAKANPDSKMKSSNVTLKKSRSTTDVNHGTSTQSRRNVHDSAFTELLASDHEDGHRNTDMTLARNARCSSTEEDNFKPSVTGTVTISKDLWSQVERCLRLMTSFFSQFNSDCCNESSDNNCNRKALHRERSEHSISSSIVKQKLFHDVTSKFQASVPQGQVVEKLFVRRKGSKGAGVELASRQTFLSHSNSKISEVQSVDSGFCHATENSSDVDELTHGCTLTASSASRGRVDALPSHKTIVKSGTSEEYGNEAPYLKSLLLRPTAKSVHGSIPSSCRRSLHETSNDLHPTSTKKRRRRYRLVRRRSSCGTTRRKLTNDRPRSEHEQEYETPFQDARHIRHVAKSERTVDPGLPESDTENVHIHAKDEKTALENNKYMSPDMDEVILFEAPPYTPALAEIRATPNSLQEHCRSSTPRKQIGSKVNNPATNQRNPDTYLETSFKRCSDTHADLIPSPIKSALTPNTHQSWSKSSERFINAPKDSLLDTPKRSMLFPVFLPEISVDFMKTEDILKKSFFSSEGKLNTRDNDESRTIQNHRRYPKTLFASSPSSNKRRSSSSSRPSPTHDAVNHLSKQIKNPKKKFLPSERNADDQHVNLIANAFNVDEKLPARPRQVRDVCHPGTDSDQAIEVLADEQSRPRSERCATDKQALISPKTPMVLNNMKGSPTMTQCSNNIERNGEQATSDKLNRYSYDSGKLTSPVRSSENQRQRRFIQQKVTPRRAKFHPYAAYHKFLRSPSLSSTFQDLTIKSPTLSCGAHRWSTLDRVRMPNSVYAPRKTLDFSSNEIRYSPTKKINSVSRATKLTTTESDGRIKDDDTSSCSSSGKCRKTFCFNCSMDFS